MLYSTHSAPSSVQRILTGSGKWAGGSGAVRPGASRSQVARVKKSQYMKVGAVTHTPDIRWPIEDTSSVIDSTVIPKYQLLDIRSSQGTSSKYRLPDPTPIVFFDTLSLIYNIHLVSA